MVPHHWSRVPAENQSSDPNAYLKRFQPANSLGGAIRGLMATAACARDDNTGTLVARLGASNVYAVATNERLIDPTTEVGGLTPTITKPFLLRLSFDTALAGSATNIPHLKVDGFDCGPILRRDGSALADGDLTVGPPVVVLGEFAASTDTKVTRVRVLDLTTSDIAALIPSGVPVGALIDWPSIVTPANYIEPAGLTLPRADYPALWAFAQASGMIVSDAAWGSNPGMFSTGDGATTFRTMDVRGDFIRVLDSGRGVDGGRALGSFQGQDIQSHGHGLTGGGLVIQLYGVGPPVGLAGSNGDFSGGLHAVNIANAGGTETRSRNTAYRKLLKYK